MTDPGGPIFILGLMKRTGTNFLFELLKLHPDVTCPELVHEDYVLHYGNQLVHYAEDLNGIYREWGMPADFRDTMLRKLGDGVVESLRVRAETTGRLLTKTPSVENLDSFFDLFPDSYAVVLIRDGRAVAESNVKSWGWNYESTMHRWVRYASLARDFARKHEGSGRKLMIVRYEDLVMKGEETIRSLLRFLDLDEGTYDFDSALNLPIYGSTFQRGESKDIHWDPVKRTEDFNPLRRWEKWPAGRVRRFNWIAGRLSEHFGYALDGEVPRSGWPVAWQRLLDARWAFRERFRGPYQAWQRFEKKHLRKRDIPGGVPAEGE